MMNSNSMNDAYGKNSSGRSPQKNVSLSGTQNTVSIVKNDTLNGTLNSLKHSQQPNQENAGDPDDEYGDEYYEEEEEEEEDDLQKKKNNQKKHYADDTVSTDSMQKIKRIVES